MSTVAAESKPSKAAQKAASSRNANARAERIRSKDFAREMTSAFHSAKLRALDADKPRK